jgi:hypothetical protein
MSALKPSSKELNRLLGIFYDVACHYAMFEAPVDWIFFSILQLTLGIKIFARYLTLEVAVAGLSKSTLPAGIDLHILSNETRVPVLGCFILCCYYWSGLSTHIILCRATFYVALGAVCIALFLGRRQGRLRLRAPDTPPGTAGLSLFAFVALTSLDHWCSYDSFRVERGTGRAGQSNKGGLVFGEQCQNWLSRTRHHCCSCRTVEPVKAKLLPGRFGLAAS